MAISPADKNAINWWEPVQLISVALDAIGIIASACLMALAAVISCYDPLLGDKIFEWINPPPQTPDKKRRPQKTPGTPRRQIIRSTTLPGTETKLADLPQLNLDWEEFAKLSATARRGQINGILKEIPFGKMGIVKKHEAFMEKLESVLRESPEFFSTENPTLKRLFSIGKLSEILTRSTS